MHIWILLDRSGSMEAIAVWSVDRVDAADPTTVAPLDRRRPRPRGLTPLCDAVGLVLDRGEQGGWQPAVKFVAADGLEHPSHNWTRERVFTGIATLTERGWTFVFLGANQESYATGGGSTTPRVVRLLNRWLRPQRR